MANTVEVKLVSPIVLSERGDANIIVHVGKTDYNATIRKEYINGKYEYRVRISGLTDDVLKNLGVELDTSKILQAHAKLFAEKEAKEKQLADNRDTIRYENWMRLAKELQFKALITLEEFLKQPEYDRRNITLYKKEMYKNTELGLTLSKRDEWYEVRREHEYSREWIRKTKSADKLSSIVEELLTKARSSIDHQIELKEALKNGLAKAQETFGKDIVQGSIGYRAGNTWGSEKCFEYSKGDSWRSPKVSFKRIDEKTFEIKRIEGAYTEDEIKKILDVVRNAKTPK